MSIRSRVGRQTDSGGPRILFHCHLRPQRRPQNLCPRRMHYSPLEGVVKHTVGEGESTPRKAGVVRRTLTEGDRISERAWGGCGQRCDYVPVSSASAISICFGIPSSRYIAKAC